MGVGVDENIIYSYKPAAGDSGCADVGGIGSGFIYGFIDKLRAIELIIGSQAELHIKFWPLLVVLMDNMSKGIDLLRCIIITYYGDGGIVEGGKEESSGIAPEAFVGVVFSAYAVVDHGLPILYDYYATMGEGLVFPVEHGQEVTVGTHAHS